ncbi:hypothetical protein BHM03_00050958 [Ensete ventricosum]|uniref:Uncharacterized protein n=1 Tax=Ensete ventricosum TaxID=4639 RepID=A0A445MLM8_ENSVE|nr:hypothetical protein BHM03_00050958 [Ensete ventricosum]
MSITSNTLILFLSVTFSPTYSFDVLVEAAADATSPRLLLNLQSSALATTRLLAPNYTPPLGVHYGIREAIDAKREDFENRMEEKMQSLFTEFNIGQPSSPRKSQQKETSNRRDDPQERGHITSDLNNPRMKVDFPRWEGDPSGGSRAWSAIFDSTDRRRHTGGDCYHPPQGRCYSVV